MKKSNFKILTLCSAVAVLCGSTQLAHAHAGFKDAVLSGEGVLGSGGTVTTTWNAVKVTHGCASNAGGEGSAAQKDVTAVSVLFPNAPVSKSNIYRSSYGKAATVNAAASTTSPAVTGSANQFITGSEQIETDLSKHIASGLPLAVTPITGNGNMFASSTIIIDSVGNTRGWQSWNGTPFKGQDLIETVLKPSGASATSTALSPFGLGAVKFRSDSCAKALKIRVAVANWCEKGKVKGTPSPARLDVWIGHMTTKFNDPLLMPNGATVDPSVSAYWPTITVTRDLINNPLPGTKVTLENGTVIDKTTVGAVVGVDDSGNALTGYDTGLKYTVTPAVLDASGNVVTAAITKPIVSTKTACTYSASEPDTLYIEPTDADIDAYLPIYNAKFPYGAGSNTNFWPVSNNKQSPVNPLGN